MFLTRAVAFAWQVQRYGSSMIAVDAIEASDADLREAQKKFLEERAKLKQTYEASTDSTYKGADETGQKKNIYVTIVGGLIVLAFVVPMLQFFYYTGGYVLPVPERGMLSRLRASLGLQTVGPPDWHALQTAGQLCSPFCGVLRAADATCLFRASCAQRLRGIPASASGAGRALGNASR